MKNNKTKKSKLSNFKNKLDFWATNSEEGGWNISSTDEGSQKMLENENEKQIKIQTGTEVVDDFVIDEDTSDDERMIVNMGPQHPSTHGVLRLQAELEGEVVRRVKPIIGYLHTGMEKTGEELNYFQGPTNTTRMDYLSPLFNELVFSLTTEKLIGIEVPKRAETIRILMTELNRVSSHLVALATGGMDIGALSMMIFGFRERELILNFFEKTTGLRMNHNYIRPGGVAADLPDGWQKDVEEILKIIPEKLQDYDDMLLDNPIWKGRLQNVGILTTEECFAYGVTGPSLRASGYSWDLRKSQPYSGIENYEFDVPTLTEGDVFARWRVKVLEIFESLKIIEQAMNNMPKGPYKVQDKKITPPPRKRLDESMEALIHHFKIYTEGFKVPEGDAYVAVELNRVSSHLVALATGGMDIGALSMMIFGFRERELILNFFEKTTGLRMNHNYIRPGGVAADLPDGWQKDVEEILKIIPEKLQDYDDMLLDNPIWKGRLQNVGILTTEECFAYGVTGPSLRASGYSWDLRKSQPYSGIENYEFDVPTLTEGDVFARWRVKVLEIFESLKIIEQAMNNMPKGPYKVQDKKITPPPRKRLDESMEALIHHFKIYTEGFKVPEGDAYVAVESPRGELGCYIVSDGSSKPYRMHVRGPSFCNLQALPVIMTDSPIADAVAAIASLDPVIGDVDR